VVYELSRSYNKLVFASAVFDQSCTFG